LTAQRSSDTFRILEKERLKFLYVCIYSGFVKKGVRNSYTPAGADTAVGAAAAGAGWVSAFCAKVEPAKPIRADANNAVSVEIVFMNFPV